MLAHLLFLALFVVKQSLDTIVLIIDVDGFRINSNFLCTELGVLNVMTRKVSSFFFEIGVYRYSDLGPKANERINFLTHYWLGYPNADIFPRKVMVGDYKQDMSYEHISIYKHCSKSA